MTFEGNRPWSFQPAAVLLDDRISISSAIDLADGDLASWASNIDTHHCGERAEISGLVSRWNSNNVKSSLTRLDLSVKLTDIKMYQFVAFVASCWVSPVSYSFLDCGPSCHMLLMVIYTGGSRSALSITPCQIWQADAEIRSQNIQRLVLTHQLNRANQPFPRCCASAHRPRLDRVFMVSTREGMLELWKMFSL